MQCAIKQTKKKIFTNGYSYNCRFVSFFSFLFNRLVCWMSFFPSCAVPWFEFSRAAALERAGMLCRGCSLASVSFKRQSAGCLSHRGCSFAALLSCVCYRAAVFAGVAVWWRALEWAVEGAGAWYWAAVDSTFEKWPYHALNEEKLDIYP